MRTAIETNVCEECGLPQTEWSGNGGRGIHARGAVACCVGCSEGVGCTCKETGVRRVVVVNSEQNKDTYIKKMDRQIKDWQARIKELESQVKGRQADKNPAVRRELETLQIRVQESRAKLGEVKGSGDWAQKARGASANYRRMKASAESLGSKVKKK